MNWLFAVVLHTVSVFLPQSAAIHHIRFTGSVAQHSQAEIKLLYLSIKGENIFLLGQKQVLILAKAGIQKRANHPEHPILSPITFFFEDIGYNKAESSHSI